LHNSSATNVNLKVRGSNGAIVKKIGKKTDIVKGVAIADLTSDNKKQIIVALEISPKEVSAPQKVTEFSSCDM